MPPVPGGVANAVMVSSFIKNPLILFVSNIRNN